MLDTFIQVICHAVWCGRGVKEYDEKAKQEPLTQAFLYPAMMKFFESEILGKKSFGCWLWNWQMELSGSSVWGHSCTWTRNSR